MVVMIDSTFKSFFSSTNKKHSLAASFPFQVFAALHKYITVAVLDKITLLSKQLTFSNILHYIYYMPL